MSLEFDGIELKRIFCKDVIMNFKNLKSYIADEIKLIGGHGELHESAIKLTFVNK